MSISKEDFEQLRSLVMLDDRHTELDCAKYLYHAAAYLIRGTAVQLTTTAEDRNHFGSTDFVVSGTLLGDQNQHEDVAYIWELKAPQCYLFELDDNQNRCRPTHDFIKAENQLIHYADQALGDDNFRQRFSIMNHRNIRIGGVVIG